MLAGIDGRFNVTSDELTVPEAVAQLLADVQPAVEPETCRIVEAIDRVLATDIIATADVPAFDNAAMDGYAVRAADCIAGESLQLAGRALAGHPYAGALPARAAVRITTGAAVPAGADTVVMQEDVLGGSNLITCTSLPSLGDNIRPRGEHLRRGEVILTRGRRLRPYDIGLAVAAGSAEIRVRRRLRVGVLSTGDELVDPPQASGVAGQYDGNRPMLMATLRHAGYDVQDLGIVADRAAALAEALATACGRSLDAVISSGGVAQGDADFVRRFPAVSFVPLAVRPGRGIACGRIEAAKRACWLFGLPGNPVAAYVMHQLVVAPLLARLAGAEPEPVLTIPVPLAVDAHTRPGRVDWRRGRWVRRDGVLAVEPLAQQSSSMLRTLSNAQALVAIGPMERQRAGDPVDVIPLAALD
jgi:molybdopterin molybdotransferase